MQQDIQKIWESDEQQQEADQKMCERRSRYGTKEGTDGSQQRQQGQQQQEQQEKRSVRLNTQKKKGASSSALRLNAVKQTRRQLVS
jgi:hypothetical protein